MAYITISNGKKIVRRLDEQQLAYIDEVLYKRNIDFFNLREIATLKGLRELIRNAENFASTYYKPIEMVDSKKYLYPEKQPAYHISALCPRITANFKNIEIPVEIVARGESDKFRKWYNENNIQAFEGKEYIYKVQLTFPYVGPIVLKTVDYGNSGQEEKKNYSLKELENEIDKLLDSAEKYFDENSNWQPIIIRYKKASFMGYTNGNLYNKDGIFDDKELREFLRNYHETFKKPVTEFLEEYYRVQFNPDMSFEGSILSKLGFNMCYHCHDVSFQIESHSQNELKP